jgi:hypothetical protein
MHFLPVESLLSLFVVAVCVWYHRTGSAVHTSDEAAVHACVHADKADGWVLRHGASQPLQMIDLRDCSEMSPWILSSISQGGAWDCKDGLLCKKENAAVVEHDVEPERLTAVPF